MEIPLPYRPKSPILFTAPNDVTYVISEVTEISDYRIGFRENDFSAENGFSGDDAASTKLAEVKALLKAAIYKRWIEEIPQPIEAPVYQKFNYSREVLF